MNTKINMLQNQYVTKSGTTIIYSAIRLWSERGFSFAIWKETISIPKGYKKEYIGSTNPFGRENVIIN